MVEHGSELVKAVVVLAAGVIAVPLFKRLGLGSVLGYLAAGLAIGPSGFAVFADPEAVLGLAEFGVVMFLFVIGLEMQPRRLWSLRREIFGLGLLQVLLCGGLLTAAGVLAGFSPAVSFVASMGFVLSSTAIVMQMLDERGETSTKRGQRIVSVLLLEDLAIVPLLAVVAALAPTAAVDDGVSRWVKVGIAVATLVALVAVSRFLLNPLFRILSKARAREVMGAAALLVVLGAALAMQWGGLSMALGAFAAGVMLSESTFRHQLEADVEPFRGLLLGLFFMGVGMSLDLALMRADWLVLLGGVVAAMAIKSAGVYAIARLMRARHPEALERAALMTQGGEFAFVLYGAAAGTGLIEDHVNALLTAAVILSMALTPLVVLSLRWLLPARPPQDMDGVKSIIDAARAGEETAGNVVVIGFGRFGQIACQTLLARGVDVTIIEQDTDMIRTASRFGFHAYYGDGTRMDVLRAAGTVHAQALLVCVNDKEAANRIVEQARKSFPLVPVLARAYDRQHAIELIRAGVHWQMRETFESAMAFGSEALRQLGVSEDDIAEVAEDVRRRDAERLQLQMAGGISQGLDLVRGNRWTATPLTKPRRAGNALNDAAAAALESRQAAVGKTDPQAPTDAVP
ncbi:monovalent cation:proton antiporter-2 (CPA2) family protein [Xylophilus sp. GOD-11R]|uniref:monovalent cation:proton antiporter-2 (CPA2) family protein n=1 Tax=Xylophilus sp. GOD-11R TaxID=3089814 RepID=UPI00298BDEEB|nr:monovalent cation:proton antiporter-2 (CPA2) family protein [Xylophilus sp. GOD-11R]WPB59254.1 monovalent cation:proton antiporter-2 (CPA2) family protein [Xylophilus sp. GOD-11R]